MKKGENDRGDDEKKDNERDELSHKGGKSHVHGAQPEWLGPVGELAKYQMGFVQFAKKLNICFKLPGEHINVRLGSKKGGCHLTTKIKDYFYTRIMDRSKTFA